MADKKTSAVSSASGISEEVPFPYVTAHDMRDYMIERMLIKFYRSKDGIQEDALDKKVQEVYEARYGTRILPGQQVESVCLHGLPGVGKTSSIRAAAKEVAKLLEMNLVLDPTPPYVPKDNDLIISTLEMSGEVSNIIMGGIPQSQELPIKNEGGKTSLGLESSEESMKYMGKLPFYQLALMKNARAPILLLDDFANASPTVQNSCLSIALEGRFQMIDLGEPFVALTANLGSLDNSNISQLSDPMMGRIGHYYVEDTLEDFSYRAMGRFKDEISDAGILSFLEGNPKMFIMSPKDSARQPVNGVRTPYPSSRTWDKVMNEFRIEMNKSQNGNTAARNVSKLTKMATALVGKEAGLLFGAHIFSIMNGIAPLAKKAMSGNLDEKEWVELEKELCANDKIGSPDIVRNNEHKAKEMQMAYELSAYAAAKISRLTPEEEGTKKHTDICDNYTRVLSLLSKDVAARSLSNMAKRLLIADYDRFSSENSSKNKSVKFSLLDNKYTSQIYNSYTTALVKLRGDGLTEDQNEFILNALTGNYTIGKTKKGNTRNMPNI